MSNPLHDYRSCPYGDIPPTSKWLDAVTNQPSNTINPHTDVPFQVTPKTRIGTGGSCFAQRIAQALLGSGFNYLVTEAGPPWLTPDEKQAYNFGTYSARYGNIYTALQLVQLLERALGKFHPQEPIWRNSTDRFFDPLRPRIQPNGFASEEELLADQSHHLQAVKMLFESLEVFVFTLGMTEAWRSRRDGTVFPICPGCGAGTFDPAEHEFHNFGVTEVIGHLDRFFDLLGEINPSAKVILTVSPVPLLATMTGRHVLQATTYSKSVLRVAAEEIAARRSNAAYFASYEIATATFNNHSYFALDRRSITTNGVDHIMDAFFKTFTAGGRSTQSIIPIAAAAQPVRTEVVCDELAMMQALGNSRKAQVHL